MMPSPVRRYTREHDAVLASFRAFVARELMPLAAQTALGSAEAVPRNLRRFVRLRAAELGFYAGEYPEKVGGQAMPFAAKILMHEYAESCGCPLAPHALCTAEGPTPLLLSATPEQQDRYLAPLVAGTLTRCLALTEPSGGSDAFPPSTRAVRNSPGWTITGRKCFVSDAAAADLALVVAAVTDSDPAAPSIGVFVVEMEAPGVTVEHRYDGLADDPLYDLLLDDVTVGESALLGAEADGAAQSSWNLRALARGRIVVAARCNGIAARALELGVAFTRSRTTFGLPLHARQHVQEHVVASRVALESARLLTFAAAQHIDEDNDAVELASMAKLAASEGACQTVDKMFQIHGASAWVRGHPMEYLYRHVRAMTLVEGTSEIQKVILAAAEGMG